MAIKYECPSCGSFNTLQESRCWKCKKPISEAEKQNARRQAELSSAQQAEEAEQEVRESIEVAQKTGDWTGVPAEVIDRLASNITVSTSHTLGSGGQYEELDVVSTEVVYGMNAIKDMMKSVRDLVGGRSETVEKTMRESRKTAIKELKREAFKLNADAVLAIDLDYAEIGGASGGMTLLVATGTAVRRV